MVTTLNYGLLKKMRLKHDRRVNLITVKAIHFHCHMLWCWISWKYKVQLLFYNLCKLLTNSTMVWNMYFCNCKQATYLLLPFFIKRSPFFKKDLPLKIVQFLLCYHSYFINPCLNILQIYLCTRKEPSRIFLNYTSR